MEAALLVLNGIIVLLVVVMAIRDDLSIINKEESLFRIRSGAHDLNYKVETKVRNRKIRQV